MKEFAKLFRYSDPLWGCASVEFSFRGFEVYVSDYSDGWFFSESCYVFSKALGKFNLATQKEYSNYDNKEGVNEDEWLAYFESIELASVMNAGSAINKNGGRL